MNYGKNEVARKLQRSSSKAQKVASKLVLWLVKLVLVLFTVGIILSVSLGYGIFKGIIDAAPEIDVASIEPSGYATMVYDSKGNLTETLVKSGSNRLEATYEELPQCLIDAFVAIEDSRFWSHHGVDLRSMIRAAVGILTNNPAGGGSTLTQQLIKNNIFAGGNEDSFGEKLERKLQEQYLALQLEKIMDKEIILKNYLNTINLGNNTLGVKSAAKRYFGKDVSDLTLSEATVIAGITQNPTKYNPLSEKGQKNNEEKRRVILQYMYEQGKISKEDQEEALADDVYSRIQNVDLVTQESQNPYSYFTDELTEQVMTALQEKLGYTESQASNLLYAGGLSIYTTQDPDLQAIVDEEVNNPDNYDVVYYSVDYRLSIQHEDETVTNYSDETMKTYYRTDLGQTSYDGLFKTKEEADAAIAAYKSAMTKEGDTVLGEVVYYILQPQVSFVLMDQHTGYVKAVNGGRGTKEISLSLNRATNTLRQPGSTFKVLTAFAPALDTCGATLSTVYYDAPYTVGQKTFRNWYAKKGYMGYSTIRDGIVYSMNIVAVRCMMETVTPQLGVEYARNFGITSLTETDYNAATALGGITKGVSNLELTGAYAAIANGGIYTKPVFFTKILDHNGKVLLENEPQTKRVLKDSTAFLLTDALAESMESSRMYASPGVSLNSTSVPANIPGMSNAGKSGTTTSNVDIWFVGYTPYYTAGIWSGCDDNQKISAIGSSTSYHKRIWKQIMARAHEGLADTGFPVPDSIETASVCRKSGMLPNPGVCEADPRGSAVYTEYFAKGTVPTQVCDHHVAITVCGESGGLPTEFCPLESRHSRTVLVTPEGESGGTDDSRYAMPGPCTVHTQSAVVLPSENETAAPDNETVPETTAPFIPSSPLDDIYIPVGPGYM
ncbi:transglycosylase domain-containing protein [Lachnospiraceae bacterium BX10]|jgi:penicillin-binding protein 1A|uniref:Penicillin-binding protein 1A n=2 Tax=Enterocloster TaxID=2719313 RepID=A0ABR7NTG4_9FIRM|nr:transglycosylase domain-containing protein [Enterocloster hominis]MBC8599387.1 transglycosylase domain-containing protein [Enterocloster hominis]